MVSEEKLEKVISICHKKLATTEEIVDGCSGICRVVFGTKKEEPTKGYLSCSLTDDNDLALCLWKKKKNGKFEKIEHAIMHLSDMMVLRAHIDLAFAATALVSAIRK